MPCVFSFMHFTLSYILFIVICVVMMSGHCIQHFWYLDIVYDICPLCARISLTEPSVQRQKARLLEINEISEIQDWRGHLICYITSGELPSDPQERTKLKHIAYSFSLVEGTIYKAHMDEPGEETSLILLWFCLCLIYVASWNLCCCCCFSSIMLLLM
jgi:hypothetical protein